MTPAEEAALQQAMSQLTPEQRAAVQQLMNTPLWRQPLNTMPSPAEIAAGGQQLVPFDPTRFRLPNASDPELPPVLGVNVDPFNVPLPFTNDDLFTAAMIPFGLMDAEGIAALEFAQGFFSPTPPTTPTQAMGTLSSYLLPLLSGDSRQPPAEVYGPREVYGPPAPSDAGDSAPSNGGGSDGSDD
jgi:hypothetical protein